QLVDRFRARFGDRVAVLHSGLSAGERFDQWRRIREGSVPIAIGARSAVFAPFSDLGLIVIDEEHDSAYKSEDHFRYHAREVAGWRARSSGCPLVLGSATPDVETAWRSAHGEIRRLVLPERVANRPLPEVQIIDMAREKTAKGKRSMLSRVLRRALADTLAAGKQAILFLNRRGFATMVYCFSCGNALRCKHCDISLVYHATGGPRRRDNPLEGELRCHYCNYVEAPRSSCPECGSAEGSLLGFGTEQLEEEVAAMYPSARVGRLDRDTTARKGEQRRILAAFHRGDYDVLVGTQMLAKGHDIPGITLVGVIAADLGMHFPDFRAGERTFQLLTQVAGRAGRGDEPGRVVIQTFLPDHYAIALARTHDFPSFYREEIRRREPHRYPPFRSLVHASLVGKKEQAVEDAAHALARLAVLVPRGDASSDELEVLGPAPAPITRIRDEFRWQFMLLGDRETVREIAAELRRQTKGRFPGVSLRLDTSPLQML
ncbi:MAG: primosomal protein N', partial [bacterium]|nr:primosomal protein N' [bacterium]